MNPGNFELERMRMELAHLRRSARRAKLFVAIASLAALALVMSGLTADPVQEEIRTRRLVVVDDAGVARVVISQDPRDSQRRSRAAGITIHDAKGHEGGGFSTMDDGSVVLAMDAPRGVGAPMPDRIGLIVYPDGSSYIMVIDNQTRGVARMDSDADGKGGLKVFKWDMENKRVHTRTFTYDGEKTETSPMGG